MKRFLFRSSILIFVYLCSFGPCSFSFHVGRKHSSLPSRLRTQEDGTSTATPASLKSVTFPLLPKGDEPDLLCDFLMEIGACSTSIIDADRGTDLEVPLFAEPTSEENSNYWQESLQWAAPVWNRCNVTAHFPASIDLAFVYELVRENFPNFEQVLMNHFDGEQTTLLSSWVDTDRDWVAHVQKNWKPILVANRVLLKFPWHKEGDITDALVLKGVERERDSIVELLLQGGVAFGTGEHPTTQLCLEWLSQVVESYKQEISGVEDPRKIQLLDYGSGSGVLGMAACALAPGLVQAVGVDIDLDACLIANTNAINNDLPMKNYLPPISFKDDEASGASDFPEVSEDAESSSILLKAHQASTSSDNMTLPREYWPSSGFVFDICVANILAGPLQTLAPTITRWIEKEERSFDGRIGLSGILSQQADDVISSYRAVGWELKVERELDGWVLLSGTKSR